MNTRELGLSRKIAKPLLTGVLISVLLFSTIACGKSETMTQTETTSISVPTSTATQTTTLPSSMTVITTEWSADGIINSNEYSNSVIYDNGNFEIYWKTVSQYIYFGIKAKTDGWVSIGLNATQRMKNADMILGWVSNGTASVSDEFSTSDFGPHSEDTTLGGTADINEFNGKQENNYTTIEFKRALVTGDTFDASISQGIMPIIWSYSSSDDINTKHTNRGYGQLRIQ